MDRFTDHQGCRLAYAVEGRGPAVLLIQGVGVHGAGWRPQVDQLARSYTCVSFDNRGMAQSQPIGGKLTVEQMAGDACAVLDAAGMDVAHIVGHSLGGLIAIALSLRARARVRSLSLLCSFPSGRMVAPLTARMAWLGFRARCGTREMRRMGFLRLVVRPGPIPDASTLCSRLAELFGHDLGDQPPIVGAQLRAMRAANFTTDLKALAGIPVLIVSARHDPIAPPQAGRAIHAGIPGSRYLEIEDASHGLPITHADTVNTILREHLSA